MTKIGSKSSVCTGCRLRRRKCDRESPICSSCKELNVPSELCIYRELRSNSKTTSSREVLEGLKVRHSDLVSEKFRLKRIVELELKKRERSSSYKYDSRKRHAKKVLYSDNRSFNNNSVNKKNDNNSNQKHGKEKLGSISWRSLMSVEPNMKALISYMDKVIKSQKELLKNVQSKVRDQVKKNPLISQIRSRFNSLTFGLDFSEDYGLIEELFRDIERNLPKEDVLQSFLDHQFRTVPVDFVGWMSIDKETYYDKLHCVLKFDEEGRAHITIKLPEESNLVSDLAFVVSSLIFPAYHTAQLMTVKEPVNYMLFVEYSEVLSYIHNQLCDQTKDPFPIMPGNSLERIQTFLNFSFFDRYTPQGRQLPDDPYANYLNVRQLIAGAKILNFNQDIDAFYADRTPNYRRTIKSCWYFLAFADVMESLETGLPPKIEPNELRRYEDHTDSYIESLFVLNRVLYKYNTMNFNAVKTADELISIINDELIGDLRALLDSEYRPFKENIKNLENFDFTNILNAPEFIRECCGLPMRFTVYSLIQTLYFMCYKKLESIDRFPKATMKFGILSMKYSSLIIYCVNEFFSLFDKLMEHPNCYDFGVLECVMACFPHMNLAVRRVYICAGGRLCEGLPINKSSEIKKLFYGKSANEGQLLNEIQLKKEYQVLYTLEDLEDRSVDNNDEALFDKFMMLLDHKYMIFSFSSIIKNISIGLYKENFNTKINAKTNHVFFYLLKFMSFFLNSSFTSDGTPIEKENSFIGLGKLSASKEMKQENEFNFAQLFEEAINTTSDRFDFENFFNISTGQYQSSDIDQFLTAYPH